MPRITLDNQTQVEAISKRPERLEGTDVVELILKDHRMVENLINQLRIKPNSAVLEKLAEEFIAHSAAEETEVYNDHALRAAMESAHIFNESLQEHEAAERALADLLEAKNVGAPVWMAKLECFAGLVKEHVAKEEQYMLNHLKENCTAERRAYLGERFAADRAATTKKHLARRAGQAQIVRELVEQKEAIHEAIPENSRIAPIPAANDAADSQTSDIAVILPREHREIEKLIKDMQDHPTRHMSLLCKLSTQLMSHSEAEEVEVYRELRPVLESAQKYDLSLQQHKEAEQTLLELMEAADTKAETWGNCLAKLGRLVTEHAQMEEEVLIKYIQENIPLERRQQMGAKFLATRIRKEDANVGSLDHIRRMIERHESQIGAAA